MEIHTRRLRRIGGALLSALLLGVSSLSPAAISSVHATSQARALLVDNANDTSGQPCDTIPGNNNCSLRSAIEIANAGTEDTDIQFSGNLDIRLDRPLPTITRQRTTIKAETTQTVKVTFSSNPQNRDTIFRLGADGIILEGLTIYDARGNNDSNGVIVQVTQAANRKITIRRNTIGSDGTGNCSTSQSNTGIYVSGPTDDGSAVYIYGNIIECSNSNVGGTGGIIVFGGKNVKIGVTETGASGTAAERNIIRGNRNGVGFRDGTQNSQIKGNTIITSRLNGIYINPNGGATPINNSIEANLIGTNDGMTDDGNGENGIEIVDSKNTVIGGSPENRNVVSGNGFSGIEISGPVAEGNVIASNYIGVTRDAQRALPNGNSTETASNGIYIGDDAFNTTVGGDSFTKINIIAGNTGNGIMIDDGARNNTVRFNDIGFNSANGRVGIPNGRSGIKISRASGNIIGPEGTTSPMPLAAEANFIWYNTESGIEIDAANGNFINSNSISRNTHGVDINNSNSNRIYRTRIFENNINGIYEHGNSSNYWSQISTNSHGISGITKSSQNPAAPRITKITRLPDVNRNLVLRIEGTSTGLDNSKIQLYAVQAPFNKLGEGEKFVQEFSVTQQNWSVDVNLGGMVLPSLSFTIFQTNNTGTNQRSSQFSNVYSLSFMPFVSKPN